MKTSPSTRAFVIGLLLALPLWLADFKFAALCSLFSSWVLLIGEILIDYAKADKK